MTRLTIGTGRLTRGYCFRSEATRVRNTICPYTSRACAQTNVLIPEPSTNNDNFVTPEI
jgi:hypothetical protein